MRDGKKNYTILGPDKRVVDLDDFRKAPWQQHWDKTTFDFRRWLYVGRPKMDEHDTGSGLQYIGRDKMVEALCDAVWHMPTKRASTKWGYCNDGMARWFEYLDYLHAAGQSVTELDEIDLSLMEGYIHWLLHTKEAATTSGHLSYVAAKDIYSSTKAVLQYLVQHQALSEGIFPQNPFPNSNRAKKSHRPYPKRVIAALLRAMGEDIRGLRDGTLNLSGSETLTLYLLVIAARSGRNPEPLLQMTRDALRPHPIKPDRLGLLVTFKYRGNSTSVQAFAYQQKTEDMVPVPMDVVALFHEVIKMTALLADEAAPELRNRLWLFRNETRGQISTLKSGSYRSAATKIVKRHNLMDENELPLMLNISRLRATFSQRMWEITGGDVILTAQLNGNSPTVTDRHYLAVTQEMIANHRRLGHLMHFDWSGSVDDEGKLEELSRETGIPISQLKKIYHGENNTGVGRCRDPLHGHKAPDNGDLCTRWRECFDCPDQVVMESDLYRLFSFYWLLTDERNFISLPRWDELYKPIICKIDQEIVAHNLRSKDNPKGCFDPYRVKKYREEARSNPHPMWRDRAILGGADEMA